MKQAIVASVTKEGLAGRPIEAIFSDIDGTLIHPTNHTLQGHDFMVSSKEMLQRIELSHAVELILTTGRSPASVEILTNTFIPWFDLSDHYVIGNNGNLIYGPGWNLIHSGDIDPEALKFLEAQAEDVPDIDLFAYLIPENKYVMTYDNMMRANGGLDGPKRTCEFLDTKILPEGQSLYDYVKETNSQINVIKVKSDMFPKEYYDGYKGMNIFDARMKEPENEKILHELGIFSNLALADSIDILPLGVNKKMAVEKLLATLKLSRKQCMSLGDGSNDIEFMQACDTPVAMRNGKPSTRRNAARNGIVTEHIKDHGWYNAVDKFVSVPPKRSLSGDFIRNLVTDDYCHEDLELGVDYLKEAKLISGPEDSMEAMAASSFTGLLYGGMTVVAEGHVIQQVPFSPALISELRSSLPAGYTIVAIADGHESPRNLSRREIDRKVKYRALYAQAETDQTPALTTTFSNVIARRVEDPCDTSSSLPLYLLTPTSFEVQDSINTLLFAMDATESETLFVSRNPDGGMFEIPNCLNNALIKSAGIDEDSIHEDYNYLADTMAQVYQRFINLYNIAAPNSTKKELPAHETEKNITSWYDYFSRTSFF